MSEPRPAATVIIVRDGEGTDSVEVLMTERHGDLSFAGGALVFPGGLVEADDHSPDLAKRCQSQLQKNTDEIVNRIAAIRETFEETGLLFAFDADGWSIGEDRQAAYATKYMKKLRAGETTFGEFAAAEELQFAADDFLHFAHWITPEISPKRFDTQFYLAAAPEGQSAACDGEEAVNVVWVEPRAVLDRSREKEVGLMFPTRLNLEVLAPCRGAHEALRLARQRPVVTVTPEIFDKNGETWARIPPEAGYGISEARRLDLDFEGVAN